MSSLSRCGPYELRRFVEAGGMGEIFLSEGPTPRGPGPAAVKRLLPQAKEDPVFVEMFLDEGRLAKLLRHPNICQVFDLGQDGDQFYIAMEWVDGVSLKQLGARAAGRGGMPVAAAARIIADVASALDYAHRLRDDQDRFLAIVHRDVSPPNIMVDLRGRVKLLDFGLAKARTQLGKTQPGYVKGKFGYLAPEQLTGEVDARTDVFALGLCLWEAVTGQPLFDQETAAETVVNIRAFEGPPSAAGIRPEVWPELDAVLQRSLSPDKGQRFKSAAEMRNAIEAALAARDVTANADTLRGLVRELFPERKPLTDSVRPPGERPPPGSGAPVMEVEDLMDDLDRQRKAKWVGLFVLLALVLVGTAAALLLT